MTSVVVAEQVGANTEALQFIKQHLELIKNGLKQKVDWVLTHCHPEPFDRLRTGSAEGSKGHFAAYERRNSCFAGVSYDT